MAKIVGAINMTLDGYCDHTAINPDETLHRHYGELLDKAGAVLYGRITYQLMEFWKTLIDHPSGEKSMDEFAVIMNRIPKIVFSHTLKNLHWDSATLASRSLEEEVLALRQQPGKDILVGCRSLIVQLMEAGLIDELQLCIHPVVAGSGLPLFEHANSRQEFKLMQHKIFQSGAIVAYYGIATP